MGPYHSRHQDRRRTGVKRYDERLVQPDPYLPDSINHFNPDVHLNRKTIRSPSIVKSDDNLDMTDMGKRERNAPENTYSPSPVINADADLYSSPKQNPSLRTEQYEEITERDRPEVPPRSYPPIANIGTDSSEEYPYLDPKESTSSTTEVTTSAYDSPNFKSKSKKAKAQWNYEAIYETDISFKRGDIIQLIKNKEVDDWYFGTNVLTGQKGYVPKNLVTIISNVDIESQRCFFKNMDRRKAEVKLREPELNLGTYLLRPSGGDYALSLRCEDDEGELEVKHFKIRVDESDICYIAAKKNCKPFGNMVDLIRYYTNVPDLQCKLKEPLPRETTLDDLAVSFSDIQLGDRLGSGNFGSVHAGTLHGHKQVAVKLLKTDDSIMVREFRREAETMFELRHRNLVSLVAICEGLREYYIITERMSNGALLTLLKEDTGNAMNLEHLIYMMIQVAEGMCYMGNEGFVHRDLRAANVLVGDENIIKIADFGLARRLDNYGANGTEDFYDGEDDEAAFPVKWTAPEAASKQKFTVKSDVWSFGILIYEMVTYGAEPYAGMANHEALRWVQQGNRLQRPTERQCPLVLYNTMKQCWLKSPDERPNFADIKENLIEIESHA